MRHAHAAPQQSLASHAAKLAHRNAKLGDDLTGKRLSGIVSSRLRQIVDPL
jgi:hypothetical protein